MVYLSMGSNRRPKLEDCLTLTRERCFICASMASSHLYSLQHRSCHISKTEVCALLSLSHRPTRWQLMGSEEKEGPLSLNWLDELFGSSFLENPWIPYQATGTLARRTSPTHRHPARHYLFLHLNVNSKGEYKMYSASPNPNKVVFMHTKPTKKGYSFL